LIAVFLWWLFAVYVVMVQIF